MVGTMTALLGGGVSWIGCGWFWRGEKAYVTAKMM